MRLRTAALIASAYGMQTASTRPTWAYMRWDFSVDFVSDLMGRFVVTDEHLVRI
jgi:hypothetical protein